MKKMLPFRLKTIWGVPTIAIWVLLVTLLTTAVFYAFVHHRAEKLAAQRIEAYKALFITRMVHHLNDYGQLLRGAAGLFNASEEVTRQEWGHYVNSLSLDEYYPGLEVMGFVASKKSEQYATLAYEEATHRTLSEKVFRPGPDSLPLQHQALEEALTKNDIAITKKLVLVEKDHGEKQLGFLMLFPVYEKGRKLETLMDRQNALQGYVYSVFRSEAFLEEVGKLFDEYLEVHVYDGPNPDVKDLIYKSVSQEEAQRAYSIFQSSEQMLVGNHVWSLSANLKKGAKDFFYVDRTGTILIVGIILALVFFAITWMVWVYQTRDRNMSTSPVSGIQLPHESFPYQPTVAHQVFHELRTPLNNILIVTKVLRENKENNLTEQQLDQLFSIRRFSVDMLCMVDELMQLVKIQLGYLPLRSDNINLQHLVEKITRMFKPMALDKNLDFSVTIDKNVPTAIISDPQALWMIVKNLCDNAIKYTSNGTVNVNFALSSDNQALVISIKDTGNGIQPEYFDKIFEPFVQLQSKGDASRQGFGFGLTIVKTLIAQIGAEIRIESAPNEGTSFILRVPLFASIPQEEQ